MSTTGEQRSVAGQLGLAALSPFELQALVEGRLGEAERVRVLERLLADPAGAAVLRLALELAPEAERLAADLARTRRVPLWRPARWLAPLAAAALLALLLLPSGGERGLLKEPTLTDGEGAILAADFEPLSGESVEVRIFASQFDG